MTHHTSSPNRRNRRAFVATLLAYVLLTTQLTPVAFALNRSALRSRSERQSDAARRATSETQSPGMNVTANAPAPVPVSLPMVVPNITATKTDSYPSAPAGAMPGEVITYSVTITNSGTDATNVTLNDTVDPNTTIVGGSAKASPILFNDAYSVLGNVRIQVPDGASDLLANDIDPDTGTNAGLTVTALAGDASAPFAGTSTQLGQVTATTGDGSFAYNPAPGFTGIDTFTYTATDADGNNRTATVTLTITGMIWFVNSAAAAGGDGRLTTPFNCLVGAGCFDPVAADDPGDNIFLYSGSYTGGLTLLNAQKLIGQGASSGTTLAVVAVVTVPANSDALPALNGNSGTVTVTTSAATTNGVNLAVGANNTMRGFTIGNTTGADISSGANFATLTVLEVTLNGTGRALSLTVGTLAATFENIASTSSSGGPGISLTSIGGSLTVSGATSIAGASTQGISIAGSSVVASFGATTVSSTTQGILVGTSSGNLSFGNTSITAGTDGVSLQNNAAGTRTFGTLSTTNGSGVGFLHSAGGGTTTVTGQTTITNPGGRGIDIQNSTTLITFANANITQSGGTGVFLGTNSGGVTFADLDIAPDAGQRAMQATNNTGTITSTSGDITATTNVTLEITGASAAARTPLAMVLTNLDSTNSTALGVDLNFVSGNFTVNDPTLATNISNPTGIGIRVQNTGAGTVNFGNTNVSASGGTGVVLGTASNGNTGALTFTDLDIAPDSGQRALLATQNTGAITTASGTIATTNNTAVEVVGTSSASRTPLNTQLTSVSTTGGAAAPNGIRLVNTSATGSPGGFRVLGTGGTCNAATPTCTGGRITNTTGGDNSGAAPAGAGVSLDSAATVVLTSMRIDNHSNYGIRGNLVSAFTLSNSLVDGINGTNQNGPFTESSISFAELTGTSLITTSEVSGGFARNIAIDNTNGTLDLTISSCNIHNTGNAAGDDGLFLEFGDPTVTPSAVATLHVTNNTFSAHGGDHFDLSLFGSPTVSLVFTGNAGSPGAPVHPIGLGQNYRVLGASFGGTFTYDISTNTINGSRQGHAIMVNKGSGTGTFSGRVSGNTIGLTGMTLSGASESNGISVESRGGGSHTTLVTNNNIRQYRDIGINIEGAEAGTTTMNATVTGNTIDEPGSPGVAGLSLHGIQLNWGIDVGNTSTACVDIGGGTAALRNNATNSGNEAVGGVDIRLRQRMATTVRLPGYTGANNDNTAVGTYLTGRNNITSVSATNSVPTGVGFLNSSPANSPCTQPTIPTAPAPADEEKPDSGAEKGSPAPVEQITAPTNTDSITSRPFISSPRPQQLVPAQVPAVRSPAVQSAGSKNEPSALRPADSFTANPPVIVGDNLTWNVGTLPAGQSVTVTFQVVVDNPYTGGPNVSNQGTVTADTIAPVLTDDPDVAGVNNPTLTPIAAPPNVFVRDARAAEPGAGTSNMLFTVALSTPATGPVSVNFATADNPPPGPTKAVAGVDYTATSGTVNFSLGQQVQTVAVPVLADADNTEVDETFLLNLSMPSGVNIVDGQAVGTITIANPAGTLLVSELRTFGPGAANLANDDFVEIYNNTDTPHTVPAGGYGLFKISLDCNSTPVLVGTVPAATVIPARGHYLFVGTAYSLGAYAAGNATLTADLENNSNVGLFSTADVTMIASANRLDAVGFGSQTTNNCALLSEGNTAPAATTNLTSLGQHSFVREFTLVSNDVPTPTDGNDNAADFTFVDTNGTNSGAGQRLGAPGPENLAGPNLKKYSQVGVQLIDPMVSASVAPNRARDTTPDPGNNSTLGTLASRRTFTNNTGAPITRLRFRIYDITTFPSPVGTADLRARTSTNATVTVTGVGSVTALATTLETPPLQPNSGGLNSSVAAGTVTLGTPLANGASIHINFLLGVQQSGSFRVFVFVEAVP
jgi:hypothetical protein